MPHDLREPIEPDVPDVIRAQASKVEVYMLEKMSIADQMRDRIVRCLEDLHSAQAADSARLAAVEAQVAEHHSDIAAGNRRWKTIFAAFCMIGPVVLIVLERLASRIWP
jgi:hypothetical protein